MRSLWIDFVIKIKNFKGKAIESLIGNVKAGIRRKTKSRGETRETFKGE